MTAHFFSGVTTALITPFDNDQIDFPSLKKLIAFQLDQGIRGFVVCGSTGETATLQLDEKRQLVDFVLSEVSGQVPVIFGSGTNNTKESIELTKEFDKKNISGFLVVTPYYNKPPQRGLVQHFKTIAGVTNKPVILYNVPGRTALVMDVSTVKELSKVKNIKGIKEAAGNLRVLGELVKTMPKNFSILSGDDETFFGARQTGVHGVVSVVSHLIPKLCISAGKKDLKKIREISKLIFIESNPIPVKWALKEMGIIKSEQCRLPLVSLEKKLQKKLKTEFRRLGVL